MQCKTWREKDSMILSWENTAADWTRSWKLEPESWNLSLELCRCDTDQWNIIKHIRVLDRRYTLVSAQSFESVLWLKSRI